MTQNLRVELAPFGINVVNLMTGQVASNFHVNREHEKAIPADSIYSPARKAINEHMNEEFPQAAMPTDAWAKRVAAELDRAKPPMQVWQGRFSWMVWLVHYLTPHGFGDRDS